MALEIIRATAEHIPAIAPIIFDAFKGVQERHGFPLDIPNVEAAERIAALFVNRPDVYGVVATLEGKVVGSNFTQISDAVSGLGPITVDCSSQARGIGRALMRHVVDWSLKNHGPMVRLVQEGFNMASLSLYTSLGFTVVEPLALMEVQPAAKVDPTVRPLSAPDIPACDTLCTRILKVSRKNELSLMIEQGATTGFIPHGRFKGGKLVAYVIPGFLGHSAGESVDDLLATVTQAARHTPLPAHRIFIPTRNGNLLRGALHMNMRCLKPMALMALGPYEEPLAPSTGAAWTPSIAY